jgi:hypothetical protein
LQQIKIAYDIVLSSFIKFFDDDYTKKLYNSIEGLIEQKEKKYEKIYKRYRKQRRNQNHS